MKFNEIQGSTATLRGPADPTQDRMCARVEPQRYLYVWVCRDPDSIRALGGKYVFAKRVLARPQREGFRHGMCPPTLKN